MLATILGVFASVILRESNNSLLLAGTPTDDLDNSGSGLTLVKPFLCKNCLNAVSFSGENPWTWTIFLTSGVVAMGSDFNLVFSSRDSDSFSIDSSSSC